MKLAFIGLGKMGSRMVEKLLSDGHEVVVWNRTKEVSENLKLNLKTKNLVIAESIEDAVKKLELVPKIIWCMLPAGEASERVLHEVLRFVSPKDIVINGANAYYKDTERHAKVFAKEKIRFLGIGVSGGIIAEKNGYPLMAGGDESAYIEIAPLLKSLAHPNGGFAYFGTGGAGHFVKMVHNGIEYGMMQSIGEGFGVLEEAKYNFNLLKIAQLFQQGTIVDSFLVDRVADALAKDRHLAKITGEIDATGEGEWTIKEAKDLEVPIENIEHSLDFRRRSKIDPKIRESFAARMVASLRREFGGHSVKSK